MKTPLANWLQPGEFALWEPGNLVQVFRADDPSGVVLGEFGQGQGQYRYATAVGTAGGAFVVLDGDRISRLVRFDAGGRGLQDVALTPVDGGARGFSWSVPLLQEMRILPPGSEPSRFLLKLLLSITDTTGQVVVDVPLPWLFLQSDGSPGPAPLFAALPVYAVGQDRSVVWSPGDRYLVKRIGARGDELWSLTIELTPPAVTAAEVDSEKMRISSLAGGALGDSVLDEMARMAPGAHAAIVGLLLDPDGSTMVALGRSPASDSAEYLMIDAGGNPTARTSMPAAWRPVLFAGDSVLVHRKQEGELHEAVWVYLRFPKSVQPTPS